MDRQSRIRNIALCLLGLMAGAGEARASAFTVTPVRVLLGPGAASALLTVRNDSTESISFQISLRAWNQAPDGDMQLSETRDLVFFPAMMVLQPAEEKKVRVGSAFRAPVTTERSYRIFFEELPPAQVAAVATETVGGAQVRVLTKMGVPIFVQPAGPVVKGALSDLTLAGPVVGFDVRNVGNSFFIVNSATATGFSGNGTVTFTKQQDGWYVLAGGRRHFEVTVPAEVCASTERVRVEITSSLSDERGNPTPLSSEVMVPAGSCAPSGSR